MRKLERRVLILPAVIIAAAFVFTATHSVFGQTSTTPQPQNFQATGASACTVNLNWTAEQADSYQIRYAANASNLFSNYQTLNIMSADVVTTNGVSSYAINALSTSTPYIFAIQAQANGLSPSAWSNQAPATTMPLAAPKTPNFTAVQGGYGNQQMTLSLSWNGQVPTSPYSGTFIIEEATSTNGSFSPSSFSVIQSNLPASFPAYSTGGTLNPGYAYAFMIQGMTTSSGCAPGVAGISPLSNVIAVPTVPQNLVASYVYNPSNPPVNLSWSASILPQSGTNDYEILRGLSASNMQILATTTATSYPDSRVVSNSQYYYQVRACNANAAGNIGCSDLSNTEVITVTDAPQKLAATVAGISQTNPQTAKVMLVWQNTFTSAQTANYYVQRDSGNGFQTVGSPLPAADSATATMVFYDSVPAGKTYSYRVYATFAGQTSAYSNIASVDTNVTSLTNYAWTAYAPNSGEAGQVGIGAVSFSSTNEAGATAPYGVFMNNTTGVLSGYAWAGASSDYGWLSFNASDSSHPAAQVNSATGQVTGWAKFIGANSSLGAWDGWVSLSGNNGLPTRSPNYVSWGVTYSSSTGNFSGAAWGGDVAGWLSFCNTAPFPSGANYCVTTGGTQTNQGPQIIATSSTANSITITWKNPINYSQVQIEQTLAPNMNQQQIQDKTNYKAVKTFNATNASDTVYTNATNSVSYTIPGLNASSTYGVFVKGYK